MNNWKNDLHVPKVKPFSNDTWEVQGSLLNSANNSQRVPLVFPAPCRIVGLYPSLTINSNPAGLLLPTLDDLLVSLSFNQQRIYTSQIGQTAAALRGQSFVTLSSLETTLRDLNIVVDTDRPQMAIQYMWKRFIQGTPLYPDMIVETDLFVEIND